MTNQVNNSPAVNQVRQLTVPMDVVQFFHGKIMDISFHVATVYHDCCGIVAKLLNIPFVQKLGEMSNYQEADRLLSELVKATTHKVSELYSWADTSSEYDEYYEHFTYAIDGLAELGDDPLKIHKIDIVSSFYQHTLGYEPADDIDEMLDELDDDTKAVINALYAIVGELILSIYAG